MDGPKIYTFYIVYSSSSSGDKQQIDIKYKISPACLAKYKIYRDCGRGQRERAIYRVCTAPVPAPAPPPVVGKSHVLATTAARATVLLWWYSGGTQGYSRLCTHGGTPGGQCGAAVFRLLSTVSSANLSHVVNTIISQAATRAWRRDQTGNKVSGCIPHFPHTGDNLVMGSRVRR